MNIMVLEPLPPGQGLSQASAYLESAAPIMTSDLRQRSLSAIKQQTTTTPTTIGTYHPGTLDRANLLLPPATPRNALGPGWEYHIDIGASLNQYLQHAANAIQFVPLHRTRP